MIEERAGQIRITDHKTGKALQRPPGVTGHGEILQPILYAQAAEVMLGKQAVSARLFFCTDRGGYRVFEIPIDDHSRAGFVQMHADERKDSAVEFLKASVAHYAAHGVRIKRLLTDNGPAYRSSLHAIACHALGLRHLRTRPYRPRTNGKAERFIRTMIGRWAYGAIYGSSAERTAALDGWVWTYNHRRPHGSLSHKPPMTRLAELNNLARSYS